MPEALGEQRSLELLPFLQQRVRLLLLVVGGALLAGRLGHETLRAACGPDRCLPDGAHGRAPGRPEGRLPLGHGDKLVPRSLLPPQHLLARHLLLLVLLERLRHPARVPLTDLHGQDIAQG